MYIHEDFYEMAKKFGDDPVEQIINLMQDGMIWIRIIDEEIVHLFDEFIQSEKITFARYSDVYCFNIEGVDDPLLEFLRKTLHDYIDYQGVKHMSIHDFNELAETIGDQGDLYELLFNLRKNDGIFIRITNKHIVSYFEKEIQKGIIVFQGNVYLFRISDDQDPNLQRKICSCCDQEIPNLLDKLVGVIQAYA